MNRKRNRRSNRKETQPKPKTRNPKPLPGPTSGSPARTHLSSGPIFLLFPGRPILLFSLPLRPTLAPHRAGPVPQRPLSRVALHYAWPTSQRWGHPSAAARVARTRSPPRLAAPPGPLVRVAFLLPHPPRAQRKPPRSPPWLRQARIPEIPGLPFISPPTASLHPSTHTSPPLTLTRHTPSRRRSRVAAPPRPRCPAASQPPPASVRFLLDPRDPPESPIPIPNPCSGPNRQYQLR